jgi:hypothetical protein
MPVSKKGARKLNSLKKKQVDRLYITLTHAKDWGVPRILDRVAA